MWSVRLDTEPVVGAFDSDAPHRFFSAEAEEDFLETYCADGLPAYDAEDEVED